MVIATIVAACATTGLVLGSIIAWLLSNERRIATLEQADREMDRRLQVLEDN